MKRPRRAILFLFLATLLTFTPVYTTQASTGFLTNFWCNAISFLGFTCEPEIVTPVPEVSVATPPTLPKPTDYQIVNAVNETPAQNTTVVKEHNPSTTNPATVVYQNFTVNDDKISDTDFLNLFHQLTTLVNQSNQINPTITRDLFAKQVDKIYEKSNDSTDNVQDNLDTLQTNNSAAFATELLTVTGDTSIDGNTTVGGDLSVAGSITAGILNVSALSSTGALTAPYFMATSTTATNTFMGAVGIGTTTPSSKLTVVGDVNIQGTATSTAVITLRDPIGNVSFEVRAGTSTLLNTFVGVGAGSSNTTGTYNVANGYLSLYSNTTGTENTAIGHNSLNFNTTGSYNTAVGRNSIYANTTGNNNTANGVNALYSNTTGSENTANGVYALLSNTTGTFNNANGYMSMRFNTTGSENTANGVASLYSNTTGSYNTAIGRNAGRYLTNGTSAASTTDYSLFLGYNTKALTADDQNAIVIGYNANGLGSNTVVLGNDSIVTTALKGNVGIGTTTPSSKLTVTQSANTSTGGFWLSASDNTDFRSQYMNTSGVLSFYGGDTAGTLNTATLNAAGEWTNASDVSYKENIEKLSYGLDAVLALQPRSYDIKGTDNHRIGFIAQEVEEVIPEVVSGEDGAKGISYGNLVAVAISAIQELAGKVNGFAESITTKFMKADKVETNTLCLDDLCITKSQLQDILNNQTKNTTEQSSTPSTTEISEETGTTDDNSTTTSQASEEVVESSTLEQVNEGEEVIVGEDPVEIVDEVVEISKESTQ